MKLYRNLGLFLFLPLLSPANSIAAWPGAELVKADFQQFRSLQDNGSLIKARGTGQSRQEALDDATVALSYSISVSTSSSSAMSSHEDDENYSWNFDTKSKTTTKPMNFKGLRHAEYQDPKTGQWHAVVGISHEELDNIHRRREENVRTLVTQAIRSCNQAEIGTALQSLHDAYALLQTTKEPSSLMVNNDEMAREQAILYIPRKMKEICRDVHLNVVDDDGNGTLTLRAVYGDTEIKDLSYKLDGDTEIYSIRSGVGPLEVPPHLADRNVHNVCLVFDHEGENVPDPELAAVLGQFDGMQVSGAMIPLKTGKKNIDKTQVKAFRENLTMRSQAGIDTAGKDITSDCHKSMRKVTDALLSKNYASVRDLFTPGGYEMFDRLLHYGNARLLNPKQKLEFYPYGERTVCRSLPMAFSFPKSSRKFVEDVNFTFDKDGKIESVAFGLGSVAQECIFSHGNEWTPLQKMTIASFLENYKTAFALKRLDYLHEVFDDNAIIIVGHEVKKMKPSGKGDIRGFAIDTQVDYARKSKSEYLDAVKRAMESNEYINVHFSENDIRQSNVRQGLFGIQITQDYASQHYSDHGYLFLLVDLANADEPVIHIRTWQPDRNPDITPEITDTSDPEFGRYTLGNFPL